MDRDLFELAAFLGVTHDEVERTYRSLTPQQQIEITLGEQITAHSAYAQPVINERGQQLLREQLGLRPPNPARPTGRDGNTITPKMI